MGGGAFSVQTGGLVLRAEEPEQKTQLGGLFFEGQVVRYSVDHAAQLVESGAVTGCAHTPTNGRYGYGRSVTKLPLPT